MPDEPSAILARNLNALSHTNPPLASLVTQSSPSPVFSFRRAQDGSVVPSIRNRSGNVLLHSQVDPGREALRLLQSIGTPGYLVCFGLGGGFHAATFLRQSQATCVLIVERDASTLRALLGNLDVSAILLDPRARLTIDLGEIRNIVRSTYLPAICGDLSSLPLRQWCNVERDFFEKAAQELSRAAEEVRADYAVQARFGKRWFTNTILNLPAAQEAPYFRAGGSLAHVTAAGPSLEDELSRLASRSDTSIVVATDTSLPALVRFGVRPDIVVSIDCQVYSYHHFLMNGFPDAIQFFDLASPPFLVRKAGTRARFLTSAHPFARLAAASWRQFPVVDTTGGNVTHAAVSLARALGISRIQVYGADFSYPRAKPYARGTYLYDHFQENQQRCRPLESSLVTLVLGSPGLTREQLGDEVRFSTLTLLDYKARLQDLLEAPFERNTGQARELPRHVSWRAFLGEYAESVRSLPLPRSPLGSYFTELPFDQRGLWATLLPVAARVLRDAGGSADRAQSLELSRQWALQWVDRMLGEGPHEP